MRKQCFTYAKIKVQISFVITAKLISPYFFPTWIVQFYFLCPKLPASSHLLWLYSPWLLSDLGRNHNIGFLLTRLNCVSLFRRKRIRKLEEDVKTLKDDLRRMTKKCRRLEEKFDEKTAKTEAPCTSAQ